MLPAVMLHLTLGAHDLAARPAPAPIFTSRSLDVLQAASTAQLSTDADSKLQAEVRNARGRSEPERSLEEQLADVTLERNDEHEAQVDLHPRSLQGLSFDAVGLIEVRVCGNYCGPGWCGGSQLFGNECSYSAPPDSCADACCMAHDRCCDVGHGNPAAAGCNRIFLDCALAWLNACTINAASVCLYRGALMRGVCTGLHTCSCSSSSEPFCMLDAVPVPASFIAGAMRVAEDWCGALPCDNSSSTLPQLGIDFLASTVQHVVSASSSCPIGISATSWRTHELEVFMYSWTATLLLVISLAVTLTAWHLALVRAMRRAKRRLYVKPLTTRREISGSVRSSPSSVFRRDANATPTRTMKTLLEATDSDSQRVQIGICAIGLNHHTQGGRHILHNVSMHSSPGELLALMGPRYVSERRPWTHVAVCAACKTHAYAPSMIAAEVARRLCSTSSRIGAIPVKLAARSTSMVATRADRARAGSSTITPHTWRSSWRALRQSSRYTRT